MSPILLGVVVYLLILLFFDSVGELSTNFFSNEVIFVISLTFIILEINRLNIILFSRMIPVDKSIRFRIFLQFLVSILLTVLSVCVILYVYFIVFVGFRTITTELITFNLIYLFVTIFYHLYYFSIVFLNKKNKSLIQKEKTNKENLELEMESFKNHVNPELLFQSLEIIISELYHSKKYADELLSKLAMVYRSTLDNQHSELVSLHEEINSIRPILTIFKAKYKESLRTNIDVKLDIQGFVIPGTLQVIFEYAIFQNIITTSTPLEFLISADNSSLIIKYSLKRKLKADEGVKKRFNQLVSAYNYYTKKGLLLVENDTELNISIPIVIPEEE